MINRIDKGTPLPNVDPVEDEISFEMNEWITLTVYQVLIGHLLLLFSYVIGVCAVVASAERTEGSNFIGSLWTVVERVGADVTKSIGISVVSPLSDFMSADVQKIAIVTDRMQTADPFLMHIFIGVLVFSILGMLGGRAGFVWSGIFIPVLHVLFTAGVLTSPMLAVQGQFVRPLLMLLAIECFCILIFALLIKLCVDR